MRNSSWINNTNECTYAPCIVLYDPTRNCYWGLAIQSTDIRIIRYEKTGEEVLVHTITSWPGTLIDAAFCHGGTTGDKIAIMNSNGYIIYYDINTDTSGTTDSSLIHSVSGDYSPDYASFGTGNTADYLRLQSAGKWLIVDSCYVYDTDTRSSVYTHEAHTGYTIEAITSYASGEDYTFIMLYETTEACNWIKIFKNSTGEYIKEIQLNNTYSTKNGAHLSVYRYDGKDYCIAVTHDDSYRAMIHTIVATSDSDITLTESSFVFNLISTGSSSLSSTISFGAVYFFKIDNNIYNILMHQDKNIVCDVTGFTGSSFTINSRISIDTSALCADRNIFGHKTGPVWFVYIEPVINEIYYTGAALPAYNESYNVFMKVKN